MSKVIFPAIPAPPLFNMFHQMIQEIPGRKSLEPVIIGVFLRPLSVGFGKSPQTNRRNEVVSRANCISTPHGSG